MQEIEIYALHRCNLTSQNIYHFNITRQLIANRSRNYMQSIETRFHHVCSPDAESWGCTGFST